MAIKKSILPLFWPNIHKKEFLKELDDTFSTRWIGQGPKVEKFEKEFEKAYGCKYAVAVNSGTAALHLAYVLLGLREGDEAITTVLTCTATNIPLLRRRVKPVFADIKDDLTIDPEDVKRKITPNTKTIVAVDFGGKYCDYKALKRFGLPIVADMAQSVSYHREANFNCYSFQAIKHITTGDGGMLVCSNKKDYERAKRLRWFGIDRNNNLKEKHTREIACNVEESGFKYQMTDIDASLGLVGLRHLGKDMHYRKTLARLYYDELKNVVKIVSNTDWWLLMILVNNRESFFEAMDKAGIEVGISHNRNDDVRIFKKFKNDCPNMDRLESQYVCLPLHNKLTKEEVNYICAKIKEWRKNTPLVPSL